MFMTQELRKNRKQSHDDPKEAKDDHDDPKEETVYIKQYRCLEEYKLKNGGFNPKKSDFYTQELGDDIEEIIELPILQKVVTVKKDGTLSLYNFSNRKRLENLDLYHRMKRDSNSNERYLDFRFSRYGQYLVCTTNKLGQLDKFFVTIERFNSLESMFRKRESDDFSDDKNYKRKCFQVKDKKKYLTTSVFLSPEDDTLFIIHFASIFESKMTLQELLEDDQINTLDLNQFKRHEVFDQKLSDKYRKYHNLEYTLLDGIIFFSSNGSVLGAFNLASMSRIVRVHAFTDKRETFAFNSRKKELVCKEGSTIRFFKEEISDVQNVKEHVFKETNCINVEVPKDSRLLKVEDNYLYFYDDKLREIIVIDSAKNDVITRAYSNKDFTMRNQLFDTFLVIDKSFEVLNIIQPQEIATLYRKAPAFNNSGMLIHGIYSDVYAEDVINLEQNRYLNFNLDELSNEIGRLSKIKFYIPESKIAVYSDKVSILLVQFEEKTRYKRIEGVLPDLQLIQMRLLELPDQSLVYQLFVQEKGEIDIYYYGEREFRISVVSIPLSHFEDSSHQILLKFDKLKGLHSSILFDSMELFIQQEQGKLGQMNFSQSNYKISVFQSLDDKSLGTEILQFEDIDYPQPLIPRNLEFQNVCKEQEPKAMISNLNGTYEFGNWLHQEKEKQVKITHIDCLKKIIDLFGETSNPLPFNLMHRRYLFSSFDVNSLQFSYYQSKELISEERLSFLPLRVYLDSILDCSDPDRSEKVYIEYIQKERIEKVLSYDIISRRTFLYQIIKLKKTKVIDALLTILEFMNSKDIPFLFPEVIVEGSFDTAFDCAFSLDQPKSIVQRMLNLILKIDETGFVYSETIERNLDRMIAADIDITPYFQSKMAIFEIPYDSKSYFQFDTCLKELYIPVNYEKVVSVSQLNKDYAKWIEPKLDSPSQSNKVVTIPSVVPSNEEETPFFKHQQTNKTITKNNLGDYQEAEIVYQAINMPRLLSYDPKMMMSILKKASDKDISILDTESIKLIVNFKWRAYTKNFFIRRLIYQLIYLLGVLLDIMFSASQQIQNEPQANLGTAIVSRALSMIFQLILFRDELIQMRAGVIEYFKGDFWNLFDFLQFFTYITYFVVSFIYDSTAYVNKCLLCALLFIFMVKVNYYLRIFEEFGFLVQMFITVFKELSYFLLYFGVLLSLFAVMISLILPQDIDGYDGIGSFMWMIMALQTALLNSDISDHSGNTEYIILLWVIWIIVVVVGNIVVMNFIIAVVGDSYTNCMAKREAQSLKVKVDMIIERENIMTEAELLNEEYFPQFILVRRPLKGDTIQMKQVEQLEDMFDEINQILNKVQKIENKVSKMDNKVQAIANDAQNNEDKVVKKFDEMKAENEKVVNKVVNETIDEKVVKKVNELKDENEKVVKKAVDELMAEIKKTSEQNGKQV